MINIKKILQKIEMISDTVAVWSGKPLFLFFHLIFWGVWIGFKIEPFPYGLLTLLVSLEAILLSGLILSSSNRAAERDRRVAKKDLDLSEETNDIIDRMADDIHKIRNVIWSSSAK
jgi:uncharacterized membrane protein